ncbi:MAG: hypothetical protein IIZ36_02225 [Ruminococcus sp.]|nr:hypothetical protein [Ruminococcus sp.]
MIDALLTNGDVALDSTGSVVKISGFDAAVQRALICINSRRGAFIYDRNLGVPELEVRGNFALEWQRLEMLINEAVAELDDTYIEVLSTTENGLRLRIRVGDQSRIEEVSLNGNV